MGMLDGRYELQERVGAGGTAEVYRAEDVFLGRTVAIKLIRSDAAVLASPERTQREVTALAALNHPSLVTLLDARIDPGGPRYLVMEFVEGPTLATVLGEGPLPTDHVLHLAAALTAGVQAVHRAKLVHRDIKPSNILLPPASSPAACFDVKLADFGLAQLTDEPALTAPGLMVGTAAYLAPEQVRGEASGPPADIYALGLVLLESATGERAFNHASGLGAVMARLAEAPAIPDAVEPHFAELVRSMTAADPRERPTAEEVAQAIAGLPATGMTGTTSTVPLEAAVLVDDRPGTGHRRPTHREPSRATRIRRAIVVGASAAAAGLACVIALATGLENLREPTEAADVGTVQSPQPVDRAVAPVAPAGNGSAGKGTRPTTANDGAQSQGGQKTTGKQKNGHGTSKSHAPVRGPGR